MSGTEPNNSPEPISAAAAELPKQYRPADHEPRIWEHWLQAKVFHADPKRVLSGDSKPYCVLIPPPNVTAALHLGHALNNTLQDVLVRAHRMAGYEALWMPGTDHAGIATQAVVEKRVMKEEKKRRTDFTREAFIQKIQAFKDEYEATITNQLKKMGCSCDWDRQRFTMDSVCARAVREAFFRLFTDNLIYRGKRLVNWDPALQTAVADDECYDEEHDSAFYYLRYPLVHPHGASTQNERSHGIMPPTAAVPVTWSELQSRGYPGAEQHPDDQAAWIVVATTRPETYLGDSAVAINPHDPRAKSLHGLCVQLPLVGRVIPIIQDDYVVLPKELARSEEEAADPKAEFATGFLKVTPAHDQNDYELYQRHREHMDIFAGGLGRALINMMSPDGRISDKHGWTDVGSAHLFVGKSMAEGRKLVLKEFESHGLLDRTRPYRHSLKHSDRSKAIIEPFLSDQWYVKVTDQRLASAANAALVNSQRTTAAASERSHASTDGTMTFYPSRYAKTFEQWHDNIRDWCISRQLWWGHRIPIWRSPEGTAEKAEWNTKFDASRVTVRQVSGRLSVCIRREEDTEAVSYYEHEGFIQDSDVLDTWFSSALWPLSTLGWPDAQQAAKDTGTADFPSLLSAFNPTSSLSTAREIITLWVSRMTMFNRYFTGDGQGRGQAPFKDVFIHAVIQDGEGRKMSKTLGNGVDPLDIIESHGSDAMRYTLCNMATDTQDVRLPVVKDSKSGKNTSPKFDAGRNFANKVWNAARFTLTMLGNAAASDVPVDPSQATLPDRWMLSRLHAATTRIDAALSKYEFSEYAQALYDIVWRDFCDWYLEAIKPTVAENPAQRACLLQILSGILRLLSPVMPFMTEAVWEHVRLLRGPAVKGLDFPGDRHGELLATAGWPRVSQSLHAPDAEAEFEKLRAMATAVREVRAAQNVLPRRKIVLHVPASHAAFATSHSVLLATFCTLSQVSTGPAPAGGFGFTIEAQPFAVSDHLDAAADAATPSGGISESERALLTKRKGELEKEVTTYEGRLANPGYALKAPPHMVKETEDKLGKAREELAAVSSRLG
jgi:valyl-tRNA synthetase